MITLQLKAGSCYIITFLYPQSPINLMHHILLVRHFLQDSKSLRKYALAYIQLKLEIFSLEE